MSVASAEQQFASSRLGEPGGGGASRGDEGRAMHAFITELYPYCRSITGDGVRATLAHARKLAPLQIHEIPSGTPALDWIVPPEWNIRDAYIKHPDGRRLVDFHASNLHVVNYSRPFRGFLTFEELRPKLHTLPDHPEWIPYRTSYYREDWGFCVTGRQFAALASEPGARFEVCVDSSLAPGHLTYGELFLPGESRDEVLFSAHVCHPSLCNDNLSGLAVSVWLARAVAAAPRRLSYRFVYAPGAIGAITWLSRNAEAAARVRAGVVLAGLGDAGPLTYKQSRRGDALVDRAFAHVLRHAGCGERVRPFTPVGYDERQYCSPGFNLPVGRLGRTPYGEYPEYHTSADNLSFVSAAALAASLRCVLDVVEILEYDAFHINTCPWGEPQLGRRGLYRALGGTVERASLETTLLWVLNYSDGRHSLLDISERAGAPFAQTRRAAELLVEHGLLRPAAPGETLEPKG